MTHGFSNLTLESERKTLLFSNHPEINLHLTDEHAQQTTLTALAKLQNKILVTEFIYTQCKTLCLTLGDYFQQAQTQISKNELSSKIHLVSISFDVAHDKPEQLQRYRHRMHADENIWSLATLQTNADLNAAKETLGLIVLSTQLKEFVHNSAFLVISNQGTLLGIYDEDDIQGALMLAKQYSENL